MKKRKLVSAMLCAAVMLLSACSPGGGSSSAPSSSTDTQSSQGSSTDSTASDESTASTPSSEGSTATEPQTSSQTSSTASSGKPLQISSAAKPSSAVTSSKGEDKPVRKEYYSSAVGMWYTVWWDSKEADPFFYEHHWVKETRIKPVKFGYYATDDPEKLEYDFKMFKRWGIDYLLLDDTNDHGADNGNIADHIDDCFKMAKKLGNQAPKLNFAGGRPLINGSITGMQAELDIFHAYATGYADNTFIWKGKPLFVNFNIPKNYTYQDKEERFTMRPAAGWVSEGYAYRDKYNLNSTGMYGWFFDIQYPESEVYGISPGWSRSHNNLGTSNPPVSRENGDRYQQEWLNAIKRKPEMIVISSWNDHAEESGIEAVEQLEPIPGRENEKSPFIYEKYTEGYLALKTGYLDGWYYRSESEKQIYRYNKAANKLVKAAAAGAEDVVIVVPDDYYAWAGVPRA